MIGTRLGEYRILDRLGAGGMGEVYLAVDERLGRKVAVKLLAAKFTEDQQRVRRFEKEAKTASALNHPNIVTIHDLGEAEAGHYIVMEFVEGRTLRALVGSTLPLKMLARIGQQVAEGLATAHQAGVVHRDIKPENVMLRDDGYIKLVDFGLVRLLPKTVPKSETETESLAGAEALTGAGIIIGTTAYMSPEQARGQTVGSATDLFSLGILLYELATGKHPFRADSRIAVLHSIISQEPIPPARLNVELPAALEALILRLLDKNPRLRPTAAEVALELAKVRTAELGETVGRAAAAKSPRTVGRAKELEKLQAGFDTAAAGRGLILCITGEAGIGKTTLVEEFLSDLNTGGKACRIARGRCSERLAGTEAYLPFLEAIESLLHGEHGDAVARAMKLLAPTWYVQIAPLVADESSTERLMSDAKIASQERMKRELTTFLSELCRTHTLVLSFDDLHWTDVATVDLLAYVAARMESLRLLIVVTFRPTDLLLADHPFLAVKLDLQSRGICRETALEFLTPHEIEDYLTIKFPEHRFPDELAGLIHQKSDGSPLFMADLVRWLRDRGIIARDEGTWRLVESLPELRRELPESVRSMIQRKIDQLGEEDRRLLIAASVQGDEFDAAVVAKVLKADAADVEERLDFLDRVHGFVRPIREHEFPDSSLTIRFAFVHVLYQNVLYSSLAPSRRAALNAATAKALEDFYGPQVAQIASELAILYEVARDFSKAADYFIVAARNTARVYANDEAIELTRRALMNAERLEGDERTSRVATAAFNRASLHITTSRFDEAIADYELAEKVAQEAGDAEAEIRAICGSAMVHFGLKHLSTMRKLGARARKMADRAGSAIGVASAECVLANERMCSGDLAAAEEYFDRATPVLEEKGPRLQALDAVSFRGLLYTWRLEYDASQRVAQWADPIARDLGMGFHVVQISFYRGMALGNQGRLSEALETLDEGRRLADVIGERYWLPRLPNTLGWLYRELYDMDTALRLDSESVELAREMDFAEAEANACVNLGHDYLLLGEPARALEYLQRAERIYGEDVWFRWRYNIRLQAEMASYWIDRGDLKVAASRAAACLQSAESTRSNKYRAWAHKLLGDIALLEDRIEDAQGEFDSALEVVKDYRCPFIEWKTLKAAADLARRRGDSHAAEGLVQRARSVIQTLADSVGDEKLEQKFLTSKAISAVR